MVKLKLTIICLIGLLISFPGIASDADDLYIPEDESVAQVDQDQTVTDQNHEVDDQDVDRKKIFLKLTQNLDNPRGQVGWFKKIYLGGVLNVDLEHQTKPEFMHHGSNDISLASAKLNIDADVNEWIQAHLGFFYSDNRDQYYPTAVNHCDCHKEKIDFEEGYITFVNFDKSSFYFRGGKQYLPFNRYRRYPILKSLSQQLSEIRATAIELGFVDESGLYGSIYTFHGLSKIDHNHHRINNYGVLLGYENLRHSLGLDIGIGYLYNMADIGAIEYTIAGGDYHTRVGAFSGYIDLIAGPFDFIVRCVTALRHFDPLDVSYQNDMVTDGAKPRAGLVEAGYTFEILGRDSKLRLSYQCSREAYDVSPNATLQLPFERLAASYGIDIFKHVILEFEVTRDHDYSVKHGGTGKYNNIATMRITALLV